MIEKTTTILISKPQPNNTMSTETIEEESVTETEIDLISQFQRRNLAQLALILRKKRMSKTFNMEYYLFDIKKWGSKYNDHPAFVFARKRVPDCNTAACAAGWGAIAGIGECTPDMAWTNYVHHNFVKCCDDASLVQLNLFTFMFSSQRINCPRQAALRIAFVVENECQCDLEFGLMPKSYKPNWKEIERIATSS